MPRKPFTKENARENQVKSVKSRLENKTAKEAAELAKEMLIKETAKRLLANEGKSAKAIVNTSADLAETGDDKSRTFIAKTIGLHNNDEQQAGSTINININGCIEKKEDVDELV